MGNVLALLRAAALAAALGATTTLAAAPTAHAQDCPGNPDAIGTSRVITIDPSQYRQLGTLQYPQTLPLEDREVVLTFDDGPLPRNTNPVLDALAAQCVKALFFLVGEMAQAYPDTVRRIRADGHTIGTHSQDHPLRFDHIADDKVMWEIDTGIANVRAALGDAGGLAPFFRIPGFGRTDFVESELAARSLVVFSTDVVADDWHHRIGPSQIIDRAISRLEAKGKGMLLLHDIHPWTAAALPGLFKALKDHGFRIVQVVPSATDLPNIAMRPVLTVKWSMAEQAAMDDSDAGLDWSIVGNAPIATTADLPAPDAGAFDANYTLARAEAGGASASLWPDQSAVASATPGAQLPVPSALDIGWPVQVRLVADAAAELPPSAQPIATQPIATLAAGRDNHAGERSRSHHAEARHHAAPHHARDFSHRHAHARAAGRQHADLTKTQVAATTPAR